MSGGAAIMTCSPTNEPGSCVIEDGELPEEGEIMEEDEEETPQESPVSRNISRETKHSPKKNSSATSLMSRPLITSSTSSSSHKSSKYKDHDPKSSKQDALLNSWVSGVQRKSKNNSGSPAYDPNDEYYGVTEAASSKNNTSQNSKTSPSNESLDKDFREPAEVEDEIFNDDTHMFDDVDFREPQHQQNRSSENIERRRRLSGSQDEYRYAKRGRQNNADTFNSEDSPPSLLAGGHNSSAQSRFGGRVRLGGQVPRWAVHTICKFFREGYCRDGDDCIYSHNAADSNRRPELCKFYQHGYCKKGMMCQHLHGEYPCKAFHKGECTKEQCQYSHQPLNEFTQPIYDQMMKDEELASRISIPPQPLRRKVLLPMGPEANSEILNDGNAMSSVAPSNVSVLSSVAPNSICAEEKVMAATGTYGFFNPITPKTAASTRVGEPSTLIPPPSLLAPTISSASTSTGSHGFFGSGISHFQTPPITSINATTTSNLGFFGTGNIKTSDTSNNTGTSSSILAPLMSIGTNQLANIPNHEPDLNKPKSPVSTGFNINDMLEQITQKASANIEIDESPASPPHYDQLSSLNHAKFIPVADTWHLLPVENEMDVDKEFEYASQLIQKMSSSNAFQLDPRLKKLVEKQFDLATKALEIQNQLNAKKAHEISPQPSTSNASFTNAPKVSDPRSRDPRKKSIKNGSPSNKDDFESMIATQIEMANQMAQQGANLDDVDGRFPQNIIRPVVATAAPRLPQTTGVLGGLFAPLPFSSNPYGPSHRGDSPPSLLNIPGGAFSGVFGAGASGSVPDAFGNYGFYNNSNTNNGPDSPNDYNMRQKGSNSQHSPRNGTNTSRDFYNKDHEVSNKPYSRWDNSSNNNFRGSNYHGQSRSSKHTNSSNYNAETSENNTKPQTSVPSEQPISLREKRKNNEYESPLARIR